MQGSCTAQRTRRERRGADVMPRHQNDVRHFQAFIANAQTQTRTQVQLCTIRRTHTLFSPEIILTSLFPTVRIHLPQTLQNKSINK